MRALKVIVALVVVVVVVAVLGGVKALQIKEMIDGGAYEPPPTSVGIARAERVRWESTLPTVASVAAIDGVVVRNEVAGTVARIAFEPGRHVESGATLIELDRSIEQANLLQAEADADLARRELARARDLFSSGTVAEADFDEATAALASAEARVASLRATLAKKTIAAPFTGELGIKRISLGEYLEPGSEIVTLQALDRVFVELSLPQRELAQLAEGLTVRATSDAWPGRTFTGRISAIEPIVDTMTRSVKIQATFDNPGHRLRAGMYVAAEVVLPVDRDVVVVPATAIVYASYGDSLFVLDDQQTEGPSTVTQRIVRLGETRGDFVEVTSGLDGGERIVSIGGYKLRNGESVVHSELGTLPPSSAPTPDNS